MINEAIPDDDEAGGKRAGRGSARLIRVSDATGEMEQTEVSVGGLEQGMLDTDDVFIVDLVTEVFVWVGKGATAAVRARNGM